VSRKNIFANIEYMIDYCQLVNNPEAAKIFDEMKRIVQESKLKIQKLIMSDKHIPPKEGSIEFAAFIGKKKQPEPRLRGYVG
jgi:hypothetical protein